MDFNKNDMKSMFYVNKLFMLPDINSKQLDIVSMVDYINPKYVDRSKPKYLEE